MSDEREYPDFFAGSSPIFIGNSPKQNEAYNQWFHKWLNENLSKEELDRIAPKKKVKKKMWLWAYGTRHGWMCSNYYKSEPSEEWSDGYKRLDYTEIEVEE